MSDRKQQTGEYRDPVTGKTLLKMEMDRQGITGAELARLVGKSGAALRRYARGESKPSLELATNISQILGKPINELFKTEFTEVITWRSVAECLLRAPASVLDERATIFQVTDTLAVNVIRARRGYPATNYFGTERSK
tara:strand:+ start:46 stop:459 length:414 start_codon:yes stop_codon:yes gene_type:complete